MKGINVLVFLGGVAAGVLMGMFFAPDKGSVTRERVLNYLKEKGINVDLATIESIVEKVKSKLQHDFDSHAFACAVDSVINEENITDNDKSKANDETIE